MKSETNPKTVMLKDYIIDMDISINQKTGDVKRIRSRSPVFSWAEAMI